MEKRGRLPIGTCKRMLSMAASWCCRWCCNSFSTCQELSAKRKHQRHVTSGISKCILDVYSNVDGSLNEFQYFCTNIFRWAPHPINNLSIHPSIHPSICWYVHTYIYIYTHTSLSLSAYLFAYIHIRSYKNVIYIYAYRYSLYIFTYKYHIPKFFSTSCPSHPFPTRRPTVQRLAAVLRQQQLRQLVAVQLFFRHLAAQRQLLAFFAFFSGQRRGEKEIISGTMVMVWL